MTSKSLDFIEGYIISTLDRRITQHFWQDNCRSSLENSVCIPKIWFGLSPSHRVTNDLTGDTKYKIKKDLEDITSSMYPKLKTTVSSIVPDNQYIKFNYTVDLVPQVKKMTISEIERELGYKVEIVNDKAD